MLKIDDVIWSQLSYNGGNSGWIKIWINWIFLIDVKTNRKKYVKLQEKALKIDNNDESRIILEKIKKNVGNKNWIIIFSERIQFFEFL